MDNNQPITDSKDKKEKKKLKHTTKRKARYINFYIVVKVPRSGLAASLLSCLK